MIEYVLNGVHRKSPIGTSQVAVQLHKNLIVADLHSDSLLWGRNLFDRSNRGQVDIPRLIEGNVGLQVFSVVSKTPIFMSLDRNSDWTDTITLLFIANRFPIKTWFSLKERALYQAERLESYSKMSNNKFYWIRNKIELQEFLELKKVHKNIVAGLLALEGSQVLEGQFFNIEILYKAGYRMMSPTHFFDTEMSGSAHGEKKGGLTSFGQKIVNWMESNRMIVDLSHASDQTIDDVLDMANRSVVFSHTGVRGTCDNQRNLSDNQLKKVKVNGGLVGIGFWTKATCGKDALSIARAIRYTVQLVGIDQVALGSDFDGAVWTPFDVSQMVLLTEALLQLDFSEAEIKKIMGENLIHFLLNNLPL